MKIKIMKKKENNQEKKLKSLPSKYFRNIIINGKITY